jgi:ABC-type multidrug transport system fused ATPase/permease subunit
MRLPCITTGFSIFFVSGILGSIIMVWAIIFMTINYFLAIKINKLSQVQNDAKHMMIGELADSLSNAGSIKLFSSRVYESQRLDDKITNDFIPKEIKASKFRFKVDIFNDIMAIGIILAMLSVMIQLKRMKLVTIGDFVFVFGMVFQLQENLFHLMGEFHKLSDRMGDIKSSLSIYNADQSEYHADQLNYDASNNIIGFPPGDRCSNSGATFKIPYGLPYLGIIIYNTSGSSSGYITLDYLLSVV